MTDSIDSAGVPASPSGSPLRALRPLLWVGLAVLVVFVGRRVLTPGERPMTRGWDLRSFQLQGQAPVDLGDGLKVTAVRGSWIRLEGSDGAPQRWINLDQAATFTARR